MQAGGGTVVGKNTPMCNYKGPGSVWGMNTADVNKGVESGQGLINTVSDRIIGNGTFGTVYEGRYVPPRIHDLSFCVSMYELLFTTAGVFGQ